MTLPPETGTPDPIPGVPPLGQPDPPIKEPEPDRLPDENPVPNPDENQNPPQHVGVSDTLNSLT